MTPPDEGNIDTEVSNIAVAPGRLTRPDVHGELDGLIEAVGTFLPSTEQIDRVAELTGDSDPEIAEHARSAFAHAGNQLTIDDALIEYNDRTEAIGVEQIESEDVAYYRLAGDTISFDSDLSSLSTSSGDEQLAAAVGTNLDGRKQAVAEAFSRHDEIGFRLLSTALSDSEADVRLMAVEGLRQMLEQGLGESYGILGRLAQSAGDADPRVAERILQAIDQYSENYRPAPGRD